MPWPPRAYSRLAAAQILVSVLLVDLDTFLDALPSSSQTERVLLLLLLHLEILQHQLYHDIVCEHETTSVYLFYDVKLDGCSVAFTVLLYMLFQSRDVAESLVHHDVRYCTLHRLLSLSKLFKGLQLVLSRSNNTLELLSSSNLLCDLVEHFVSLDR